MATTPFLAPADAPPVSTGIKGLDHLLLGGLTPNRMYVVEGRPGTGKTTMAVQFLLEGNARGERCLYVALSETISELRAVAVSHGWSLEGLELFELPAAQSAAAQDQYTLYHPAEVELGETIQALLDVVDRVKPSRIVLDSLSELKLLARDTLRYRRQVLALKSYFSRLDVTVLLLDDMVGGDDSQLQSLSHGVILLEQLPIEYGRARRRIRIVKFRGVPATEGFHDFRIRHGGVEVFPQITPPPSGTISHEPVESGIPGLDTLLGGGLAWGTTTLVIGPSGSGKSTLATQYVANDTGPGTVYLFEERMRTYVERCDALGMRVSEQIRSGRLIVHQIEPGELSPGEFSHRVCQDVERRGTRMVLIDSINGYMHAIPQSDAPLARMHELLSFLNERGVATLLVLAQHGIIGTAMTTPLDVSYLADAVLVLRFFEAQGHVRRAISVVKMRTRIHESTIRELKLGPGRIHVGHALTEFHGVLSGVPRYVGADQGLLHGQ
ncbi:MAG: ATPase domain-containing protein [Vicinamibacteraceae bacterium]